MEISKTPRGFGYLEFKDYYDQECSLQKSSIVEPECIWLGINDADPQIMASKVQEGGTGWVKYPIPDDVSLKTRMHLSQEQVKEMLPYLEYFAEHGELPNHELQSIEYSEN